MFYKKVALILSVFFFSFCLFAESFRTSRMHPVYISDNKEETTFIKAYCNDSIGIILPETVEFLNAVEIEVKVPQSFVNEYAFFEGYGIYFDVTPEIKASTMDYKGTNLSFSPFSEKITTVLQIPVNKNHGLKSSVYSTVVEIPDRKNNQTRFLVIGKKPMPKSDGVKYKTSIVMSIKHQPGALYGVLLPFGMNAINLTRIESRPDRKTPWSYYFFVDFEGHWEDANVKSAIEHLQGSIDMVKWLGSYPMGK